MFTAVLTVHYIIKTNLQSNRNFQISILEYEEYESDLVCAIRSRKINYEQRLVIAQRLAQMIERFDSADISHRDIKPQNILIKMENNQVKWAICDFGITDTFGYEVDIEGTPGFSSDSINYAYVSDFYSVGMTLSFILFKEESFLNSHFKPQKNQNQLENISNNMRNNGNQYFKKCFNIIDKILKLEGDHVERDYEACADELSRINSDW